MSIESYSEHSLSQGSDSKAICYLTVLYEDETFHGVGIDSNITLASIKALVSSIKKAKLIMIRLILFFILLSLNLSYSADYSVNQFIEELLSSHKQKKILQLKKDVTQNEYKQSKGVTDWSIDSGVSLSRSEPTSSSSFVADYVESTHILLD